MAVTSAVQEEQMKTVTAEQKLLKVLVLGNVGCSYRDMLARLHRMYAQAKFDFVFCILSFENNAESEVSEDWQHLLAGGEENEPPCPLYFFAGKNPQPQILGKSLESASLTSAAEAIPVRIANNVFYLGTHGLWTTPQGLTVAFLGGSWNPMTYGQTETEPNSTCNSKYIALNGAYLSEHVSTMTTIGAERAPIDILLTHDCPPLMSDKLRANVSPVLADLVYRLRPRYHFCCSSNSFVERQPFVNKKENGKFDFPTRFIAVANSLNAVKERWFYAFSIYPATSGLTSPEQYNIAANSANPFAPIADDASEANEKLHSGDKRSAAEALPDADSSNLTPDAKKQAQQTNVPKKGYVCRICKVEGHFIRDCPNRLDTQSAKSVEKKADQVNTDSDVPKAGAGQVTVRPPCWFCLDSPNLAKHLIASKGKYIYAAAARGPLLPLHCLFATARHQPTVHSVRNAEVQDKLYAKLAKYEEAIAAHLEKRNEVPVFFEIARAVPFVHGHVQCVPVPRDCVEEVVAAVHSVCKEYKLEVSEVSQTLGEFIKGNTSVSPTKDTNKPERQRYKPSILDSKNIFEFRVAGRTFRVESDRKDKSFPLQIGREIIVVATKGDRAKLVDWRNCVDTDKEVEYANELRTIFAHIDPQEQTEDGEKEPEDKVVEA